MTGSDPQQFKVSMEGEREIVIRRRFAAPPPLVFRAFTEPALVRRWLLGPPDWSMPVCEIDPQVGGAFRYLWRHADGREMGLSGVFETIEPNVRIVHRERFDVDWTGGETQVTTAFRAEDSGTSVRIVVLYASREAREAASRTGMERGIAASYDRLDAVLTEAGGGA